MAVGDLRLTEDGSFRELEDGSGHRLLQQSVDSGDPGSSTTTQNTHQRYATVRLMRRRPRRQR